AHVADPGPEVFPTVHRLDQVEVIGIYHGTFDAVQISFDRGVQMVQLRRREDMRRSALVRDAEDQRSARRRFRARSKHGDESGTTRGLGNDVGDLRVAPDRPEQRAGGPFLLHHVEGPQERGELFPEGLVVIGDENLYAASLRGRRTVTVVPRPGSEATSREPPCRVAMCFARSKPRPIPSPSTFVAETGSNRCATTPGVIPPPVPATVDANACGGSPTRSL